MSNRTESALRSVDVEDVEASPNDREDVVVHLRPTLDVTTELCALVDRSVRLLAQEC